MNAPEGMATTTTAGRNARAEATAIAGREARVLEPSPPAIDLEPWFADDPTAFDAAADVVTPTSAADTTWDDLATDNPEIADYACDHWLGARKQLGRVPGGYVSARDDFHRLAFAVLSNARKAANGKFGLRYTHRGFGTPFYGNDEQARVEGVDLIHQQGDTARRTPITTLTDAATFFATVANADQAEHDTIELGDLDRRLAVTPEVGDFLGDWFGFATAVLEQTRLVGTAPGDEVSRVQIWPGHFDAAIEMGSAEAGSRATYGLSPGDQGHDEPYLYVGPWGEIDRSDPYWNDESFGGASMTYQALLAADDTRQAALDFFARGYAILAG